MTEAIARTILLAKAVEQNDTKAEILSRRLRQEATALARQSPTEQASDTSEFFHRRAEHLLGQLDQSQVQTVLAATSWRPWVTPLVATVALGAGLASNVLGPANRISILAFPLLGMLLWNLAVYLLLLIRKLQRTRAAHGGSLIRLLQRWALPAPIHSEGPARNLHRGLHVFCRDWFRDAAPLYQSRLKCALHLGAALLALGSVAGMYLRGLALEYRAGWESTFLGAGQVHQILRIVLGPASWITGLSLPSVQELEQIRWPGSRGENAAGWIHLYAVTAGLFIVSPRGVLALINARQAARLSRQFPVLLDDLYFRRVRGSEERALAENAWILPCGLQLQPRQEEVLRAFLYEVLGLNANLRFEEPIPYGEEDQVIERARHEAKRPVYALVLFNMAATPEAEHHGRLLAGLQGCLSAPDRHLVPVLEESSYRRRLSGQAESEEQIEKRRKTWQRLAREHRLPLLTLDLDAPDSDHWYEMLRQAIAPSPA